MANIGKFKNHVAESKSVTMSATEQTQTEVQVPNYGDIYGFVITASVLATGTLSTAQTLEKAIKEFRVKTKSGNHALQGIRGSDLLLLERFRNKGVSRTIATTSGSAQYEEFFIPLNIEQKDQEAKVQMVVAPYSDMATSGATGGTIEYSIEVLYYDQTEGVQTEKIQRLTKAVASGLNTFGTDLPRGVQINNILFKIGTETNITSLKFTGDGNKEIDDITPKMLKALDNCSLVSGHVTGTFSLYNSPFIGSPKTRLDVTGAGSDTMEIFTIGFMD